MIPAHDAGVRVHAVWYGYAVIALCAVAAFIDGMDASNLGLAMPAMAADWHLPRAAFGGVLSGSLLGVALGSLVFGALGDRIGRRPIVVGATLLIAAASFASVNVASLGELMACRIAIGIGAGASAPNLHALTAEFAPPKRRALCMILLVCAVGLGGSVGGLIAPAALAWNGWKGVFLVGGGIATAAGLVVLTFLPESPVLAARARARLADAMAVPAVSMLRNTRELFVHGQTIVTLSYWVLWGGVTFTFYLLSSWLPSILLQAGLSTAGAMGATALLFAGGIVGGVILGWVIKGADRAPKAIAGALLLAALLFAAIFALPEAAVPWAAMSFLVGATISGANMTMPSIGAMVYRPTVLSTGIGWASSMARVLGMTGPLAGGWATAAAWSPKAMIGALVVPTILCIGAVLLLFGRFQALRPGRAPTAQLSEV